MNVEQDNVQITANPCLGNDFKVCLGTLMEWIIIESLTYLCNQIFEGVQVGQAGVRASYVVKVS